MSQLTYSRQQLRLVQVAVVQQRLVVGLELEVISLGVPVLLGLELELGLVELQVVDWETSTFYEITLNSSNSDKLYNKTLKCSSLFCNKSALEIHSLLRS
jgi:hypothetical protein